jgi:hypothetical protein
LNAQFLRRAICLGIPIRAILCAVHRHVAGEFSSDGRSVSGRDEWNYATASGDELRLFFEWKGTKR